MKHLILALLLSVVGCQSINQPPRDANPKYRTVDIWDMGEVVADTRVYITGPRVYILLKTYHNISIEDAVSIYLQAHPDGHGPLRVEAQDDLSWRTGAREFSNAPR